jgi:drug/metabolite transporter (DMT)-like permease
MPFTISASFAAFFYVTLFSGDHVARKIILSFLTSYGANALLFLVAGSIFIGIAWYQNIKLMPKSRYDLLLMVINAVWFSGMIIFLQLGLNYSSAGLANAVFCSYPIITYFTSVIFLREDHFTLTKCCGFLFVFLGFFILVNAMSSDYRISIHIIICTLLMGSQLCLVRKLTKKYGVIYTLSWQHTLSGIFCAVIALFSGFFNPIETTTIPYYYLIVSFIYIAIIVNVIAYYIQGVLVKKYLASTVSSFILFRPILGFIIAAIFLKEPLNLNLFIASLIIGVGVFIIFKATWIKSIFKR